MTLRKTFRTRVNGNRTQALPVLHQNYFERNGRDPMEIPITGDGTYEIGSFGHDGASIQFGSQNPLEEFDGDFSATFARSLRPGSRALKPGPDPDDDADEVVIFKPESHGHGFDTPSTAVTQTDLDKITAVTGPASRILITVTGFDAGTQGKLVAWVM